ncbi:DNA/RNA non-specific endonuclease [Bosea sp. BK604]|uniref:DNA/RNA non-specific endonuclease n=1 Tax=Bosea sp. BK604 TaxID=2512180 RepID=UPI0010E72ABE|nr:DNA/RNA non-specific endonuclease [Bosea sp. BK604]TCR60562.1 DNA/RNA endonuclease G (NUC1) [Bosea sp. BK604]
MSGSASVDFFSSIMAQDEAGERETPLARLPSGARAAAALESRRKSSEELVPEGTPESLRADTEETLRRLRHREPLDQQHRFALEAIIIPDRRPPILIRDGDYTVQHRDWLHLNTPEAKALIRPAIAAACRIELPDSGVPFLGTGFLVGDGLLMTNRHVAEAFVDGVGRMGVRLSAGAEPFVDFLKEHGNRKKQVFEVTGVAMVHPYWDMALLKLSGLPDGHPRLRLTLQQPDDMLGHDVVVIGYPARDEERNAAKVQRQVFGEIYDVKRLMPGKIGGAGATAGQARLRYPSYEQDVSAMLHNASTLGGASGSLVLNLTTGDVLGLHFAGEYLRFNCAVPAAELATDARVVDAGVHFAGNARGDLTAWRTAWNRVERAAEPAENGTEDRVPPNDGRGLPDIRSDGGVVRLTVPLEIELRLGAPTLGPTVIASQALAADDPGRADDTSATEKAVEPFHEEDYETRDGYNEDFLGVALPLPTVSDLSQVSRLDDGDHVLRYQNFSIVMNKARRLALFSAANVDGTAAAKRPDDSKATTRGALGGLGESDTEKWFTDPRIPALHQLPDRFFTKDRQAFDKGHLVRREDAAWGHSFAQLRRANGDTYHVTNCSPQVAGFNRSAKARDNWGALENFVAKAVKGGQVSLFSGPIFERSDDIFHGVDDDGRVQVKIPKAYWKVVVEAEDGALLAYAFVQQQDLSGVRWEERLQVPAAFKPFMLPLADLERRLEFVVFPPELHAADQFHTARGSEVREAEGLPGRGVSRRAKRRRTVKELAAGPKTFRDPILSVFQSATAKFVRERAAASTDSSRPSTEAVRRKGLEILDAERACEATFGGEGALGARSTTSSRHEGLTPLEHASHCAKLLLELAKARAFGDEATAKSLLDQAKTGKCDPAWADTVYEHAKAYGVLTDPSRRVYVPPRPGDAQVIPMNPASRIAIFGDWGTGAGPARLVMSNIREKRPDILLHLGDIYYSGTPDETKVNFEDVIAEAYQGAQQRPAIYTLCGNHDMYSGGQGYHDLIARLNTGKLRQKASWFCLRATDNSWQILAMDSGRNDYHPLLHRQTFIEEAEQLWLVERVKDFPGRTILASHHQLFSAFDAPGGPLPSGAADPVNRRLKSVLDKLVAAGGNIVAWFWGHEHNLGVYEPYAGLARGRCVGHGGVPVFTDEDPYEPLAELVDPPEIIADTRILPDGEYYAHGFAILELKGGSAEAAYFQNVDGVVRRHYVETIA